MKAFSSVFCPVCHEKLQVQRYSCPNCHAEYPAGEFLSPYDYLNAEDSEFLAVFLKCRGNLKEVSETLSLSYPTVKKRLERLLEALGFASEPNDPVKEEININRFAPIDPESTKASDLIRKKLYEAGGTAIIPQLGGKPCLIRAERDGTVFTSDKLSNYQQKLDFSVFDLITEFLLTCKEAKAPKGRARKKEDKVGFGNCTRDTVMGIVAYEYYGKQTGDSSFDPVFVLSAVLDWAGIAKNGRGFLQLTPAYLALRKPSL